MQITHSISGLSATNTERLCPVCGYEMEYAPEDYNICPSCGTEFGVNDRLSTLEKLREAWVSSGMKWWSSVDPQPEPWKPEEQLRRTLITDAPWLVRKGPQVSAVLRAEVEERHLVFA
jgi:hypothetical protein